VDRLSVRTLQFFWISDRIYTQYSRCGGDALKSTNIRFISTYHQGCRFIQNILISLQLFYNIFLETFSLIHALRWLTHLATNTYCFLKMLLWRNDYHQDLIQLLVSCCGIKWMYVFYTTSFYKSLHLMMSLGSVVSSPNNDDLNNCWSSDPKQFLSFMLFPMKVESNIIFSLLPCWIIYIEWSNESDGTSIWYFLCFSNETIYSTSLISLFQKWCII